MDYQDHDQTQRYNSQWLKHQMNTSLWIRWHKMKDTLLMQSKNPDLWIAEMVSLSLRSSGHE
jgi:hypothetical protein